MNKLDAIPHVGDIMLFDTGAEIGTRVTARMLLSVYGTGQTKDADGVEFKLTEDGKELVRQRASS